MTCRLSIDTEFDGVVLPRDVTIVLVTVTLDDAAPPPPPPLAVVLVLDSCSVDERDAAARVLNMVPDGTWVAVVTRRGACVPITRATTACRAELVRAACLPYSARAELDDAALLDAARATAARMAADDMYMAMVLPRVTTAPAWCVAMRAPDTAPARVHVLLLTHGRVAWPRDSGTAAAPSTTSTSSKIPIHGTTLVCAPFCDDAAAAVCDGAAASACDGAAVSACDSPYFCDGVRGVDHWLRAAQCAVARAVCVRVDSVGSGARWAWMSPYTSNEAGDGVCVGDVTRDAPLSVRAMVMLDDTEDDALVVTLTCSNTTAPYTVALPFARAPPRTASLDVAAHEVRAELYRCIVTDLPIGCDTLERARGRAASHPHAKMSGTLAAAQRAAFGNFGRRVTCGATCGVMRRALTFALRRGVVAELERVPRVDDDDSSPSSIPLGQPSPPLSTSASVSASASSWDAGADAPTQAALPSLDAVYVPQLVVATLSPTTEPRWVTPPSHSGVKRGRHSVGAT